MRTTRRNNYGYDLFDELFKDPFFTPAPANNTSSMMKTDIRDMKDHYEMLIDLPGFKKDEMKIELNDGYLTISAEKGLDKDETDKNGSLIRQERYAGSLSRSYYVGEDITENDIHAKFENGVLTIDVPKKEETKPVEKYIAIE